MSCRRDFGWCCCCCAAAAVLLLVVCGCCCCWLVVGGRWLLLAACLGRLDNIVLTGGNTLFRGFCSRLQMDLKVRFPPERKVAHVYCRCSSSCSLLCSCFSTSSYSFSSSASLSSSCSFSSSCSLSSSFALYSSSCSLLGLWRLLDVCLLLLAILKKCIIINFIPLLLPVVLPFLIFLTIK